MGIGAFSIYALIPFFCHYFAPRTDLCLKNDDDVGHRSASRYTSQPALFCAAYIAADIFSPEKTLQMISKY